MSGDSLNPVVRNIFERLPNALQGEVFEKLEQGAACSIERIVSRGQKSPDGFWYDQEMNEWVIVLRGRAGLRFQGSDEVLELGAGDFLTIPAGCRHRVEWTDAHEETLWLAVHYR